MALDIEGSLVQILPEVNGTGKNGSGWVKQEFIIETADQYPKKICISVWGEKVSDLKQFAIGDKLRVAVNLESREYNSRWYTEARAWKLELVDSQAVPRGNDMPPNFEISGDDLPF